jgi:hypothetical protein
LGEATAAPYEAGMLGIEHFAVEDALRLIGFGSWKLIRLKKPTQVLHRLKWL